MMKNGCLFSVWDLFSELRFFHESSIGNAAVRVVRVAIARDRDGVDASAFFFLLVCYGR